MKKVLATISLLISTIAFSQISLTESHTNVVCNGASNGSATLTPSGGISPYTYTLIAPFQANSTGVFSGLPAGTYSAIGSDAMAATNSITFTITEPTQLVANISSQTNASCFGLCDGGFNIAATGGSGLYYYATNLGTIVPNNQNVCAGVWSYTVGDANNCVSSGTVAITQPPQIIAGISSQTNVSCNGACDGSFNVFTTGGTVPYTFMNNMIPCTANNTAQCPGTKTITITDANNCVFAITANITQPNAITVAMTTTNSNCGQANGALCASYSGGQSPYFSQWSNGNSVLCNNNIPAGVYTFTVTDSNGCTGVSSGLVNDIAGPVVSITNTIHVSCFNGSNGGATSSVTGGVTPYTYSWTGPVVNTPTITGIPAGLYNLTVTDAVGCVGTQSVLISQPPQLTANVSNVVNSCSGGCNGSATIFAMGGNPAYAYSWNTTPPQNNATITNVCPGTWLCTVTDINGCIATASVTIAQQPAATLTINHTNVSCGNPCSGSASASISGGNIASFLWYPGLQTGSTVNNLCPGTYTLNVTTNNACTYTDTVTITNAGMNTIPNATLSTTVTDETCLNTHDGNIDLTVGGTNPGPFTYQWSNGATTQDVFNVSTGNYFVTVYDASLNCLNISSTVVAIGINCGNIMGNVFADNNSDCIKNSGDNNLYNIQVIANPGNKISYTNFNGDYTFSNLPFGTYSITANTNTVTMEATCGTTNLSATLNSTTPNSINNFVKEYIPPTQPDIYVSGWSNGIVPGFVCRMNYLVYNYNNFNANGVFKAVLPSAFIPNITSASPATYTLSGDTIIWNFSNINTSGWSPNFYVDFTTPLSTPLGSTFSTCMWAQPSTMDLNNMNNNTCYYRLVTGSYDPNDKTASPVGIGPNGDIAATVTDLTYLIRFQNTGNGPAVNIVVTDTLSSNVDVNTFEMLGASHNYNIDILPGNILRWKFNNIMLVDSGTNEPASHGHIQYRIKRNSNNTPGTQIKNIANIYFDFNAPVITNTAINTIETITSIKSSNISNDQWLVYPNPSTDILNLINNNVAADTKLKIEVLNSFGQIVLEENASANHKTIDMRYFSNGVYFVKITSDKQSSIKRVVLNK